MNYQHVLYKPRKEKNGMAANFSVSDRGCFLTLAKQVPSDGEFDKFDWADEKTKKNKHVISLGIPDLSSLLALFNGKIKESKLYHEYEKAGAKVVTNVTASPYSSKDIKTGEMVDRGYSINITRAGEKFGFGISHAEAEVIKVLFNQAILNLTYVQPKKD